MGLPYFPLYVTDYEADTAHLTLEEDGVYMRLLRLCWRTVGCSIPADPKWISRHMRVTWEDFERVVAPILSEFFKLKSGRYYSPRLVKEAEKISVANSKRKIAGSKGGVARALKYKENVSSNAIAMLKHPEPEPEPYKERDTKVSLKKRIETEDGFDDFWSIVPRRVGKAHAKKAWTGALRKASSQTIIEAMSKYARQRQGQDPQYTAHPATWLNGERWLDEASASPADFYDQVQQHLQEKTNGLPETYDIDHLDHHRLSAPVSAPDASGRSGRPSGNQHDCGGSEQSGFDFTRPRGFPRAN